MEVAAQVMPDASPKQLKTTPRTPLQVGDLQLLMEAAVQMMPVMPVVPVMPVMPDAECKPQTTADC